MNMLKSSRARWILLFALCVAVLSFGQGKKLKDSGEEERDHPRERDVWFRRGRPSGAERAAEKLHRAYQQKMAKRSVRVLQSQSRTSLSTAIVATSSSAPAMSAAGVPTNGAIWLPLGPAPEASDSSGSGSQDYGPVTGRATAVVVDQNDLTGNTVYVGGAYGGVWKSTNAADATVGTCSNGVSCPPNVTWTPLTDNQATLAVGSIAIQPGNGNVVLVGTGESNSSADSYYGLGILRSGDAGKTWTLITSAGTYPFRGLAFSRIAFSTENANLVVASTAAASGGITVGGEQTATTRGLYYSTDAGQTWSYRTSASDGASGSPAAGSVHSAIYFPVQHKFYAALRGHGIYSSTDGKNWTRLPQQPGSADLTSCPTNPTNLTTCPLYRAELAVVPGRNEMYVWMVDSSDNNQGLYQTRDGGNTWTQVSTTAIKPVGSKLDQATYNLSLAAVPDGTGTDLYAGAVDEWKAILPDPTSPAGWGGFVNLTHVYECPPNWGSYSHVHPDEHSVDFSYQHPNIIYFANDGGIYRTLSSFATASGVCGTNPYPWDNLNSKMGSMTQYVWFSNHPSDPNTLVGGTQDNGSPATASGTSSQAWVSVNNGDGGYNAIDPSSPSTWYTSNTYVSIQRCTSGINCTSGAFLNTITPSSVSSDSGSFYTPFMLDPQNPAQMIVGTCRVWRGNADGTSWTNSNALSYPNFSGAATGCPKASSTNGVDNISALAAGGPKGGTNSSRVVWAGTENGRLYITTNADSGLATWADVTASINPKNYPISSIALDPTDPSGQTAYVTIMGFDVSHVWRTINGGQNWTDFTGDLPNAPADGVVVDPGMPNTIFVGTDVGVFATTNGGVNWTEVGLDSNSNGTLPNVAITRMAMFTGGTTEHLRVSTYGRGVWDIDLGVSTSPNFALTIPNATATVNAGQTTILSGRLSPIYGYSKDVVISCSGAATATCTPGAASYTVNGITMFTLTVGNPTGGDFTFDILATGTDGANHVATVTVHVQDFSLGALPTTSLNVPRGTASDRFYVPVGSAGGFSGQVNVSCAVDAAATNAMCFASPNFGRVSPTSGMLEEVNVSTAPSTPTGTFPVTITYTASNLPTKTQTFNIVVLLNPDYVLPYTDPNIGVIKATTKGSGAFSVGAQDGYSGILTLTCTPGPGAACEVPQTVTPPANVTVSITPPVTAAGPSSVTLNITDDSSPAKVRSMHVYYTTANYAVQSSGSATVLAGVGASVGFNLISQGEYSGSANLACDVTSIPGATCTLSPGSVTLTGGATTPVTAAITIPQSVTLGAHDVVLTATDASLPALTHAAHATVGVMDFTLAALQSSATVKAGGSTPYDINVTPGANGIVTGTVNYSCSGLPQLSNCTFAPSSQVVGASATATRMTITTTAPSGMQTTPVYALLLPVAGIAVLGIGVRRRRVMLTLILAAVCALALLQGCGGGSHHQSNPGTPAGTYTITVSASLGSAQRTTAVTLTVQ